MESVNHKPPSQHLLHRQATTPHLHPTTLPFFPSPPSSSRSPRKLSIAAAAARRTGSLSTKAQLRAPEEELSAEVFVSSTSSSSSSSDGCSRRVVLAAATLGIAAALVVGADGVERAWALGPEGPLVEEFWDNMRRYGLYIVTVSTGALYTILQPIVELLKNPISAILLLVILGGSFYLLSQVLSFMVGINDFSYDYAN